MNDRQLRSFLLACNAGSFSRAAEKALISKPAFVQQINLLQRELGFELFVRTSRGVTPTEAGAEFARVAQNVLASFDEGAARCRHIAAQDELRVRIGYDPTEIAPFMGDVCSIARSGEIPVVIEFVESPFPKQFEALAGDAIDVCFFADSPLIGELGLVFDCLYEEGQCCCMSPHNKLAGQARIKPMDLAGYRLYIEPIYTHETQTIALLEWFEKNGMDVQIDGRPFDSSLPAHIVMDGGVIPVPQRCISDCVPPLTAIPLDWPPSRFGAVHRPQTKPGVKRFIEAAQEYFASE